MGIGFCTFSILKLEYDICVQSISFIPFRSLHFIKLRFQERQSMSTVLMLTAFLLTLYAMRCSIVQ